MVKNPFKAPKRSETTKTEEDHLKIKSDVHSGILPEITPIRPEIKPEIAYEIRPEIAYEIRPNN